MKFRFIFLSIALLYLANRGHCQDEKKLDIDRLVHRMTEESGGDSAIAAIKTHVSKYISKKIDSVGQVEEITPFTVTFKRPNKIRFDVFNMHDSLIFSLLTNGEDSWAYVPDEGIIPTHPRNTEELISWAEHWMDEWRIYKDIDLKIEYVNDVIIGDIPCYKMRITDRFGIESYWYVNRNTYLMARITYPEIDIFTGENLGMRNHDFTEFYYVGVVFPTKEIESFGTKRQIHEMVKWTMNHPLNDSIFEADQTDIQATSEYLRQLAESGAYVKPSQAQQPLKAGQTSY